jgi:hypothetical protein
MITLNEKENVIIRDVDVLTFLSCSVLLVDLSRLICQVNLSRLTYPRCPVLDVLSWLSLSWLSIMVVMPRLSGTDCSVPAVLALSYCSCPFLDVLPQLSCPSCPVLPFLTVLFYILPWLSCHRCPVPTVLSSWPVAPVLYRLPFSELLSPSFPFHDVLFMLSCSECPVHLCCPRCLVLDA